MKSSPSSVKRGALRSQTQVALSDDKTAPNCPIAHGRPLRVAFRSVAGRASFQVR